MRKTQLRTGLMYGLQPYIEEPALLLATDSLWMRTGNWCREPEFIPCFGSTRPMKLPANRAVGYPMIRMLHLNYGKKQIAESLDAYTRMQVSLHMDPLIGTDNGEAADRTLRALRLLMLPWMRFDAVIPQDITCFYKLPTPS